MEEIIEGIYDQMPYYSTIGMNVKEIANGKARIELIMREELSQNGMIHGGVLASMIDASCACAAFSATNFVGFVTTIDLQVSYLKPVSKGTIIASAECLRAGKNVLFCESKIKNEERELVCVGTSQLLRI
ncbi:MAG: PaaI family thioesterase [Promethearchaeota archaeon]